MKDCPSGKVRVGESWVRDSMTNTQYRRPTCVSKKLLKGFSHTGRCKKGEEKVDGICLNFDKYHIGQFSDKRAKLNREMNDLIDDYEKTLVVGRKKGKDQYESILRDNIPYLIIKHFNKESYGYTEATPEHELGSSYGLELDFKPKVFEDYAKKYRKAKGELREIEAVIEARNEWARKQPTEYREYGKSGRLIKARTLNKGWRQSQL